ncbi:MAG: LysE family translocator [Saprospiraceae bacterium]
MIESYFSGFLAGFLMCFSLGTVFFSIIQNSLKNGYRSGIQISLGGILSDSIFISIALFGTSFLPQLDHFDMILNGIGAFFLIVLGIASLIKYSKTNNKVEAQKGNVIYFFGLGFMLNTLNPVNFFIWAAAATAISYYNASNTLIFFSGSLSAVFITQFAMSYYADYFQRYFTPRIIDYVNKIAGAVLLLTGIYLAYKVYLFMMQC